MVYVLVEIEVLNFQALQQFESRAAAIMNKYSGKILAAFETERQANDSGKEIHLLSFPSQDNFVSYRNDPELAALGNLRASAISNTQITLSTAIKNYT